MTVAAVEEIIPGLDLCLSNRNSYNYCGLTRLKKKYKKSEQREGMSVIHRNAVVQCWLCREHKA